MTDESEELRVINEYELGKIKVNPNECIVKKELIKTQY